ncbi:MAG: ATP-binding protein [Treponema sp.]|jgi:predicted AAA+ superfamily ATPase|nr:ATP-binding protein [Treponema sp.]
MKRIAYYELLKWKNSPKRRPLVLYGARQVGKTWLLKAFGQTEYKSVLYLNFDSNRKLHHYFGEDISPGTIIASLENHFTRKISPADTLLIFDEIQECPRAKDALKYFNEDAPQYNIAAAGSFLGIAEGKFPVGQIDKITLYPLSFYEFLAALGQDDLVDILQNCKIRLIKSMHDLLRGRLKEYFYTGGMPEAVKTYALGSSLQALREVQETILDNYKGDFSRHIKGVHIPKVRMLWDSIPIHLSKEKKKFIYREVKTGGRASEFENALDWLVNTGLVYRIAKSSEAKLPLAAYAEREAFKLYMLDVGLLSAKSALDIKSFYQSDHTVFKEFRGAITEQYVMQELKAQGIAPIFYWGSSTGKAEVDFIFQYGGGIVPIEVKSDINKKSYSLGVYRETYKPGKAIRTSLNHFGAGVGAGGGSGGLYSVPLYMLGSLKEVLAKTPV